MRRALRRNQRARFVVANGLRDVDRVVDAIDHIEIVTGEGGTEERLLTKLVRIDAARKMDTERSSHSLSVAPSTLTTRRLLEYG
jgi:hypothetical protein